MITVVSVIDSVGGVIQSFESPGTPKKIVFFDHVVKSMKVVGSVLSTTGVGMSIAAIFEPNLGSLAIGFGLVGATLKVVATVSDVILSANVSETIVKSLEPYHHEIHPELEHAVLSIRNNALTSGVSASKIERAQARIDDNKKKVQALTLCNWKIILEATKFRHLAILMFSMGHTPSIYAIALKGVRLMASIQTDATFNTCLKLKGIKHFSKFAKTVGSECAKQLAPEVKNVVESRVTMGIIVGVACIIQLFDIALTAIEVHEKHVILDLHERINKDLHKIKTLMSENLSG